MAHNLINLLKLFVVLIISYLNCSHSPFCIHVAYKFKSLKTSQWQISTHCHMGPHPPSYHTHLYLIWPPFQAHLPLHTYTTSCPQLVGHVTCASPRAPPSPSPSSPALSRYPMFINITSSGSAFIRFWLANAASSLLSTSRSFLDPSWNPRWLVCYTNINRNIYQMLTCTHSYNNYQYTCLDISPWWGGFIQLKLWHTYHWNIIVIFFQLIQ